MYTSGSELQGFLPVPAVVGVAAEPFPLQCDTSRWPEQRDRRVKPQLPMFDQLSGWQVLKEILVLNFNDTVCALFCEVKKPGAAQVAIACCGCVAPRPVGFEYVW